ncbi:MAG: hypothetical protein WAL51_04855 [Candidatus Acidiferrales bacterium]
MNAALVLGVSLLGLAVILGACQAISFVADKKTLNLGPVQTSKEGHGP